MEMEKLVKVDGNSARVGFCGVVEQCRGVSRRWPGHARRWVDQWMDRWTDSNAEQSIDQVGAHKWHPNDGILHVQSVGSGLQGRMTTCKKKLVWQADPHETSMPPFAAEVRGHMQQQNPWLE
jgi:hypothetical protein